MINWLKYFSQIEQHMRPSQEKEEESFKGNEWAQTSFTAFLIVPHWLFKQKLMYFIEYNGRGCWLIKTLE